MVLILPVVQFVMTVLIIATILPEIHRLFEEESNCIITLQIDLDLWVGSTV